MPDMDFVLPHWMYWLGLIAFPLLAMVLARKTGKQQNRQYSLPLAVMILLSGGLIGLHRFYLKSWCGILYLPVFVFILYANGVSTEARNAYSNHSNQVRQATQILEREQPKLVKTKAALIESQQHLAEQEEGSTRYRLAQKKLKRAEAKVIKAEKRIFESETLLAEFTPKAELAAAERKYWSDLAGYALYLLLFGMLVDLLLLRSLVHRANATLPAEPPFSETEQALKALEEAEHQDDQDCAGSGFWGMIDRLCLFSGEFVSYWAVLAVMVYYYEVVMRYVFNSPTNWAHESMYLMFGMQYLVAGSYALLCGSHVRVDIFYAQMSPRHKALVDILTSVFFFIFAGTLLWTSYIFAFDAIAVPTGNALVSDWARGEIDFATMLNEFSLTQWTDSNIRWGEISFNEWEIPLWPMKWVMVWGALLLLLQGGAKMARDFGILWRGA